MRSYLKCPWVWAAVLCLGLFGTTCLLSTGVLDQRHYPTMEEFHEIESGMTSAEVEAILGPPHEVLTAYSKANTEEQAFYKPGPDDPAKKVYCYEGRMEHSGKTIRFYVVYIGKEGKVTGWASAGHPNRSVPWRFQRWLENEFHGK
jgi:hypothetical protein